MRFSGESEKAAAIRKFVVQALSLRRRQEISQKVLTGEWAFELRPIEELRKDRQINFGE